MISSIEAFRYRSLQYVHPSLAPFQVLVGPNGSGKTSFLDVLAFVKSLLSRSDGLEAALAERTANFHDLVWGRASNSFELAVEAVIPTELHLSDSIYTAVRYELGVGFQTDTQQIEITHERVMLIDGQLRQRQQHTSSEQVLELFPSQARELIKTSILHPPNKHCKYAKFIVSRKQDGGSSFVSEQKSANKNWQPTFRFEHNVSAFRSLPPDNEKFPIALWFKELLSNGIQQLVLNSALIRLASPPGRGKQFLPDGSNLPWIVADLIRKHPNKVREWVQHVQTAIPDVRGIRTVERPDDKHSYLMIEYAGGFEVPSWMVSDGTLRLLALTLPAYIPDITGIYLIEEPENGIHPRAVETVIQSLSSVYNAQVLLATHSPVILSTVEPSDVLCFAKNNNGATEIITGNNHPALRNWKGSPNLGVLFAGGVLGL